MVEVAVFTRISSKNMLYGLIILNIKVYGLIKLSTNIDGIFFQFDVKETLASNWFHFFFGKIRNVNAT